MKLNCVYCDINPVGNSDHVFPKSLGGENIFMDCVCDKCNNDFSKIERELFQKSIIGLMRSVEGVEGYTKNKKRHAPLKFLEIFQFDKENKIVYEVGLHSGFKPYIRPQFIKVEGKFYSEAPTKEEMILFIDAFNEWRNKNLIMVTKFPAKKGDKYEAVKYILKEGKYSYEKIKIDKVKNEVIHYNLMKDNDEFKEHFEPRLFFDDSNNLIVRSRETNEGINFIAELLTYCNRDAAKFNSYSAKNTKDAIRVSIKFDVVKMQQALVKIGLNCLMNYYPETKYNTLLRPIKEYVINGTAIKKTIDKKINVLDTRTDMHSVLFYQLKQGLMIRTSLFRGQFVYSFLIENLNLFQRNGKFSGVEVDYKISKQRHLSSDEFLLNRLNNLGLLNNAINGVDKKSSSLIWPD